MNVDFADVQTVMSDSGVALMGSGRASGEDRAMKVANMALESPLLNHNDIAGAKNILINITSGDEEITLEETYMITEYIQERAGNNADIIWGAGKDDALGQDIEVTIIATGFDYAQMNMVSYSPLQDYKDSLRKATFAASRRTMRLPANRLSSRPNRPKNRRSCRMSRPCVRVRRAGGAARCRPPDRAEPSRPGSAETAAQTVQRAGFATCHRIQEGRRFRYRYRRTGEPSRLRSSEYQVRQRHFGGR